MNETPALSVLIAVKNEALHLASTLESLCMQLESGIPFETIIIDGMSTDNTKEVVQGFSSRLPSLRLLENPSILAAAGWNVGLAEARAARIMILSGHVTLPSGYFREILKNLTPDIVGASGLAVPVGSDSASQIIAAAFSCRLGNGGASFMRAGAKRAVESIAFGCYWKKPLLDIGGFDERLVRGQDWDLNLRLRASGATLWIDPSLRIEYTTRSNFSSLWRRQYFAGYWKPFIHRKNSNPLLPRHWIPSVFTASLLMPFTLIGFSSWWALFPIFVLTVHISAAILEHRKLQLSLRTLWPFWLALFVIHFAYGLGLLLGMMRPTVKDRNSHLTT